MSLSESEPSTLRQLLSTPDTSKQTTTPPDSAAVSEQPASDAPAPAPTLTDAQKQLMMQRIYNYTTTLFHQGQSRVQILKELQSKGLSSHDANAVYDRVVRSQETQGRSEERDTALKNMAIGGLVCFVGLAITIGTYSAVARTGGSYTVAYGAIIFGGLQFLRGLYGYFS